MAVPPEAPDRVGELAGASAIMDVEGAFTNLLWFYYEASDNAWVMIWSSLDRPGSMLVSIPLVPDSFWTPAGACFPDTAMSVVFRGTPQNDIRPYHDIRFVIPEPSSLLLSGSRLE
jgi:hypothetical protein